MAAWVWLKLKPPVLVSMFGFHFGYQATFDHPHDFHFGGFSTCGLKNNRDQFFSSLVPFTKVLCWYMFLSQSLLSALNEYGAVVAVVAVVAEKLRPMAMAPISRPKRRAGLRLSRAGLAAGGAPVLMAQVAPKSKQRTRSHT